MNSVKKDTLEGTLVAQYACGRRVTELLQLGGDVRTVGSGVAAATDRNVPTVLVNEARKPSVYRDL